MRIAINARLLLPGKLDGIGWFTYETCRRLVAQHPDVEFHFLFDRIPPQGFIGGPNVRLHRVFPPARRPFLFRVWMNRSIPILLRRIQADLFLSPDGLGSKRCPCAQLVVIHDINFERYPGDLPPSYARYLREVTRHTVQKTNARLATVSEFSRREICEVYAASPERIDVIPNAAGEQYRPLSDAEKQCTRERWTKGEPYFAFISSIHPRKNLTRLLAAFDQFAEETGHPHRLVVVGSTFWMFDQVTAALGKMRHRDRVIFAGRLAREDLAMVTGAAEALAFMSYYEGFGIPVLEAFRAGVPVLTSLGTAMEEVAGGAALLADPFDVADITRGLRELADNQQLRVRLIAAGSARERNFSWDHSADLLWNSIQRSLS
jgi:glycosyltransferase involved in cell wall biosynthesis